MLHFCNSFKKIKCFWVHLDRTNCHLLDFQPLAMWIGGLFDFVFINRWFNMVAFKWLGSSKGLSQVHHWIYVQTKHLQSFILQYLFQGRSYNLLTALAWCSQVPSPWDNAGVRSLSASHLGFSVGPGLSMLLISLKLAPLSEQIITCLFCSEGGFYYL